MRLPDEGIVRQYADSVPDDFLFTVKAPNALALTHCYGRQPKEHAEFANRPNKHFIDLDLLSRFLERLVPLEGKLGPVVLQFEYLSKARMPSRKESFDRLNRFFVSAPEGFQYAVELRNPDYLSREFLDLLGRHGTGYVF